MFINIYYNYELKRINLGTIIKLGEGELIDCHNHGLMEYLGHKDIQIKTKISNELANKFINNLVYIMKETGKSILDINIAPEGLNPIKYKELKDEFGEDILD